MFRSRRPTPAPAAPPGEAYSSDGELVRAAQRGGQDAFAVLVGNHQGHLYRLIWRQVRNDAVAEDLTQTSFLRAFRSIDTLRQPEQFRGWLVRIALNVTHSWLTSRSHREFLHEDIDQIPLPALSSPDSALELRRISSELGKLEKKYRDVVVLCIIESYSYAEAADILSIPSGTVASRLHVALQTLRSQLRER